MCAKMMSLGVAILLVFVITEPGSGETWYVDASVTTSGDGTTWETAFQAIQEGIDAASEGDTVIVAEGTYAENVKFNGKNIVLRSTDPTNPTVVESTTIDGRNRGSGVTFSGTENEACVLSGFTIRNGSGTAGPNGLEGGGIYGGTKDNHTDATIRNNIITGNRANRGGGVTHCDGPIQNNTVSGNTADSDGGGLFGCDGTIVGNTITGNTVLAGAGNLSGIGGGGLHSCGGTIENNSVTGNSGFWGAGLVFCTGTIRSNVISGNSATQFGGGLAFCQGIIENNTITENAGGSVGGGGLGFCDGIIRNNTIVGNSGGANAGGIGWCDAKILNCIMWGNTAPSNPQIYESRTPSYSCIEGWTGGGEGNISTDPGFVDWARDDYRLSQSSPCIDKGKNEDWMWQAADPDGNPRILRGVSSARVDMGTCEYLPEPVVVRTWHVDAGAPEGGDGTSWETAFATIQEGIDAASHRDAVMVRPGTYTENIRFNGKNIVLRSSDALGNLAVSGTIIDGNGAGSVVTFAGSEDETCSLSGFTIRNGSAADGGGILGGSQKSRTRARIENNVIAGNSAANGGGLAYCAGPILNNTVSGNQGGGLHYCGGSIHNCIIWGNTAGEQLSQSSVPTYSCIEGWTLGGEGNMDQCPYFASVPGGDFHLQPFSPCIDAGDPASQFSEEPQSNGGRINIGAYGNTVEGASKSPDIDNDDLPDEWEIQFFGHLAWGRLEDFDSDLVSNLHEYYRGTDPTGGPPRTPLEWYVDAAVTDSGDGTTQETAFKTIQEGIDAAWDGDTVIVAEGTYVENILFKGKNITVCGTDPLDAAIVAGTIIDGDQAGSVVTFTGTEDETCVLSGFTIQNGKAENGGGICGGERENQTHATIKNNVIKDNSADWAGGLAFCGGTVQSSAISHNSAAYGGGGLFYCHGTIHDSVIIGNVAKLGAGFRRCDGTISNNAIMGNSTTGEDNCGGGLYYCGGMIQSNLIAGNRAPGGAGSWGAGLGLCNGSIRNNTVVGNSADWGGGVGTCFGTIRNCIIWGNTGPSGEPQILGIPIVSYSCVQGGATGEGNTTQSPLFADADGPDSDPDTYEDNDYRLSQDSPCLDKGMNENWMWDAVDLDGNPRIWPGRATKPMLTVDMGAYEYGSFPFKVVGLARDSGQAELTWNSRSGQSYTVLSCSDPMAGTWIPQATVPSGGDSTIWSDPDTTSARKFYRIELK